jgi:hypothetical protein
VHGHAFATEFNDDVTVNGRVGIGTAPSLMLHIRGSNAVAGGAAFFALQNDRNSSFYTFQTSQTADRLFVVNNKDGTIPLVIDDGTTTTVMENARIRDLVTVQNTASAAVIEIRGAGNDIAEGFKVNSATGQVEPGMVCSIDPNSPGDLVLSSTPYERTVVGIVSGAGDKHTGLQLGHAEEVKNGELTPVALTGRVWCWVDADIAPVQPGDFLTTSATPGHAMKALDHTRAQGAIIGKAMTPLQRGTGLVLVLVSLQ